MKQTQLIDIISKYCFNLTGQQPAPGLFHAITAHYSLLKEWSRTVKLTGTLDEVEVAESLYLDSLVAASYLASAFFGRHAVHDVGSGAGFPGLFLPLYFKGGETFVMHEARRRKCSFLKAALRALGYANVHVSGERVVQGAFTADAVLSRATLPPAEWLALASTLLEVGGRVALFCVGSDRCVVPPGEGPAASLALVDTHSYVLPVSGRARTIMIYQRTS